METWDFMQHWNLVLPPSRPSAIQLNNIKSLLLNIIDKSSPVAVLGSTPEFRDLLHECGFHRIYIFEKNISFYKAMSKIRIYDNEEYLVEGDWINTLPNHKNIFYLILSDLTSGNIPYEYRKIFYEVIFNSLTKEGIFYDKILTHPGPNLQVEELIQKYSSLPLNLLYINYFSCEMLFCSELLDLKLIVDTSLFYSILEDKVKNERVRAFSENAKQITPPNCFWFYGKKWSLLEKSYCPHLRLIGIDDDEKTSPYFERLKFYTFKKVAK